MPKHVLTYDGKCAFCRMWVDYFHDQTGDAVEYRASGKPISAVEYDSYRAAEAVFHLLKIVWLYRLAPRFFEASYRFIAAHRNAGYRITRLLWGDTVRSSRYETAASRFTRALAFIYLIAFASFGIEARGLAGQQGIAPAGPEIWWPHSDFALLFTAWSGVALSLVAIIARPYSKWQRIIFAILWLYYLSIVYSGGVFMTYQWDLLLLECGFLSLFIPRVWLFHWLLFRLMFESGAVKLLSGDQTWQSLTALQFHYWTQPLPNIVSWYAAKLPVWFQSGSVGFLFAVEIALPFFIFLPRRMKRVAAWGFIALQSLIFLTGNYTYFNLLAAALCFWLFDDTGAQRKPAPQPIPNRIVTAVLFLFVMIVSATELTDMFSHAPKKLNELVAAQGRFGLVNPYGLFAVMTTTRHEIEIQGSNDGQHWQPYVFRYKPGPLERAPGWVAPFQPRLDWQMWFASLSSYRENPWFVHLISELLRGSKPVLALLGNDPFHGTPPHTIRAVIFDYRFTSFEEHRQTGNWWKREEAGLYFPPVSLRKP